MPKVLIAGGGLAGLSAAAALGGAGFDVDLFEARAFLGGRAASYPVAASPDGEAEGEYSLSALRVSGHQRSRSRSAIHRSAPGLASEMTASTT